MAFVVTATPTPEEFIRAYYQLGANGQAQRADNSAPEIQHLLTYVKQWAEDVPQIAYPGQESDLIAKGCSDQVNAIARSNPDAARRMGHEGLLKIWLACNGEAKHYVPQGYMQQVASALVEANSPRWYQSIGAWIGIAAIGLVVATGFNERSGPRRMRRRR